MSNWLDELRLALDCAPRPVSFFFRDDDAGWCDDSLLKLLDLFARYSMPLDIAAIPKAIIPAMARELLMRIEAVPERVAVHQHGFAHLNHEREGRKCEFGLARESLLQQRDIEEGKRRLFDLFGEHLSPIFTPPWNRCTQVTGECLLREGFSILSRDATATPLNLDGLLELPVEIDWFAKRKGVRLSLCQLGAALAEGAASSTAPTGIMFHHALMDKSELQRAEELLALLASHGNARCYLMEQVTALPQINGTPVPIHEVGASSHQVS